MNECYCDYCGNPLNHTGSPDCDDKGCFWYAHWQPDLNNEESVRRAKTIENEINNMFW